PAADVAAHARPGRVSLAAWHPLDLARAARGPLHVSRGRPDLYRQIHAGGIGEPHVRWQIQLARADLVPHELHAHPVADHLRAVLWRDDDGRVSHWLREDGGLAGGRRRSGAAADLDLPTWR